MITAEKRMEELAKSKGTYLLNPPNPKPPNPKSPKSHFDTIVISISYKQPSLGSLIGVFRKK